MRLNNSYPYLNLLRLCLSMLIRDYANRVGEAAYFWYSKRMKIIHGSADWADLCREFCRQAYLAAYVRPDLGITEDLFSKEVFSSPRITKYYQDLLKPTDNKQISLALDDDDTLIGIVVAELHDDYCDMRCFYVRPDLKGHGIGHELYQKVLAYAGNLPIQVDTVEYMQDTIDMYSHWGFHIDTAKGKLIYNIVEWPEAARKAYTAIYMTKPAP